MAAAPLGISLVAIVLLVNEDSSWDGNACRDCAPHLLVGWKGDGESMGHGEGRAAGGPTPASKLQP